MVENLFFSRKVGTPEGVEAVQRDDGLLEQLVIKDKTIQPGATIILCLSLSGSHDLELQLVSTKKTLSGIHAPDGHWGKATLQHR
jgi:hypothetical protein